MNSLDLMNDPSLFVLKERVEHLCPEQSVVEWPEFRIYRTQVSTTVKHQLLYLLVLLGKLEVLKRQKVVKNHQNSVDEGLFYLEVI